MTGQAIKKDLPQISPTDDARQPKNPELAAIIEREMAQLDQKIIRARELSNDPIEEFFHVGGSTYEKLQKQGVRESKLHELMFDTAIRNGLLGPNRENELEIKQAIRDFSKFLFIEQPPQKDEEEDEDYNPPDHFPPSSLPEYNARKIIPRDFLLGKWLHTKSLVMISGATGGGKSLFANALGMRTAAGEGFLHWDGTGEPCNVLHVDGEMGEDETQPRTISEGQRMGSEPKTFHVLNMQENGFRPLDTPEGQKDFWHYYRLRGPFDLIIFDNYKSVVVGDLNLRKTWQDVSPLVTALRRRRVAQIWLNHTGADQTRAYGDRTKEYDLHSVAVMKPLGRKDEVAFRLSFSKKREFSPANRDDFADVEVALIEDKWTHSMRRSKGEAVAAEAAAPAAGAKKRVSPEAEKYLAALVEAYAANFERPADWLAACASAGLVDLKGEPTSRFRFYKYRRELKGAGLIDFAKALAWPIG